MQLMNVVTFFCAASASARLTSRNNRRAIWERATSSTSWLPFTTGSVNRSRLKGPPSLVSWRRIRWVKHCNWYITAELKRIPSASEIFEIHEKNLHVRGEKEFRRIVLSWATSIPAGGCTQSQDDPWSSQKRRILKHHFNIWKSELEYSVAKKRK